MADVVGGLRYRLAHDSCTEMLRAALEALGWFDAGRRHRVVRILREPANWDEPIEPNLICVSTQDSEAIEAELGSSLTGVVVPYIFDIYAESESVGLHLSGDIFDILRGRHPDAGREVAKFSILDFRAATPEEIGYGVIADVERSRTPMRVERPWLQNWFVISANVTDHYFGDADAATP